MRKKILIIIPLIIIVVLYFQFQHHISQYFFNQHVIYWSKDVNINFSDYEQKPKAESQLKIVDFHGLNLYAENIEKANVRAYFDKNRSWVKDSTNFNIEAVKQFQKLRFDLYEVYARKFNSEIDKIRHNPKTSFKDLENIGNRIYQELQMFEDEIYSGEYSTQERIEIWKPKIDQLLEDDTKQSNNSDKSINQQNEYDGRQITRKYLPKEMIIKLIPEKNNGIKENYKLTLIKSDFLDNNFENINKYSNEIVILYYDILMKNNTNLNFDKITIEIVHNTGKKSKFDYSYEDIKEITELN
jgi:hypothetical protein